ncbi:MAG: HAMP domain-containing histidine kinase, partial [Saccharothrix sp.]|nr:HAMP domain-containing histidine kinase [Saccharothrix sp.]
DRFDRGTRAGSRGTDTGSGLGLALVAQHVQRHGGSVWVEDRPGGGARFVVEIPEAHP